LINPHKGYSTRISELVKYHGSYTNSPVHEPEERCDED